MRSEEFRGSPSEDRPGDSGGHSSPLMFTNTLSGSQFCVSATLTPICLPGCLVERSCMVHRPLSTWPILARLVSSSLFCLLAWASLTPALLRKQAVRALFSVLPRPSTKTPAVFPSWVPLPMIPQSRHLALTFPRDTSSVPLPLTEPFAAKQGAPESHPYWPGAQAVVPG